LSLHSGQFSTAGLLSLKVSPPLRTRRFGDPSPDPEQTSAFPVPAVQNRRFIFDCSDSQPPFDRSAASDRTSQIESSNSQHHQTLNRQHLPHLKQERL
jgi:hypothetical protein